MYWYNKYSVMAGFNSNSCDSNKQALLWRSLCQGDREALDHLFRCFYGPLLDYGIKIHSDRELVKDSIQELFLRLWKKHSTIGEAKSVEVYLLLSLRRILLRKVKSRTMQSMRNKQYLDHVFATSFSMEELLIHDELQQIKKKRLTEAINSLNSRQKESLFLRYYHGLTNQEIAEVMDINHQSVRNNLSRALQSLRSIVQSTALYE